MRVLPNHHRLRTVAFGCWVAAAWWVVLLTITSLQDIAPLLSVCIALLSILLLALGIAFWLLGRDKRAGIVFDSKGLLLNLGSSASFVSWENIELLGVSKRRMNWFALGSTRQMGIRLRDSQAYLQSFELRLPAAEGVIATLLRSIFYALRLYGPTESLPTVASLTRMRERTGYDILVPETFLGGSADSFVDLVYAYRNQLR